MTPSVALWRRRARASASCRRQARRRTSLSPIRPSISWALRLSRWRTRRPKPSEPSLTHTGAVCRRTSRRSSATDASADTGRRLASWQTDPESDEPVRQLPMFGDLAKALSGQGPLNWDAARQFAGLGHRRPGEVNVDPAVRIELAELARIAEMHVRDLTGFDGPSPEITPVTRARGRSARSRPTGRCSPSWRRRSAAGRTSDDDDDARRRPDDGDDGQPQPDDGAVDDGHGGRLDGRADGARMRSASTTCRSPGKTQASLCSLATSTVRRRVEPAGRRDAPVGARPGADAATPCSRSPRCASTSPRWFAATSGAFRPDPSKRSPRSCPRSRSTACAIRCRRCSRSLGDPAVLLGAVQSPEQRAAGAAARRRDRRDRRLRRLHGRLGVGASHRRRCAAHRRGRAPPPRRVTPEDLYIERLLGLRLTHDAGAARQDLHRRCRRPRRRSSGSSALLARPDALPTPAELDAPGFWVARLELAARPRDHRG